MPNKRPCRTVTAPHDTINNTADVEMTIWTEITASVSVKPAAACFDEVVQRRAGIPIQSHHNIIVRLPTYRLPSGPNVTSMA